MSGKGKAKLYDMHIHTHGDTVCSEQLLDSMSKAGIYGGCIFSDAPLLDLDDGSLFCEGRPFEERLNTVLKWTNGREDRLFPVLWIHPDEENIIEKIHIAAESGICAFKIICNNFYVYEEKSINLLREIAKLNKPVIFHSGILWDGGVSSKYNRPLNWEALLDIEGLKFSMGHCSWPWIDECIALYGKFLNSLTQKNTAEMFFDITPGTPEIYREELFTKLYTVGYDVGNNVMFGTDCTGNSYKHEWAEKWLEIDRKILFNLGISRENYEKIYSDNLLRFLDKTEIEISRVSPVPDDSNSWYFGNKQTEDVISKWYDKLGFEDCFRDEFEKCLKSTPISDAISLGTYDLESENGKKNLLSFLFMCEELSRKYRERGIGEDILTDTLGDIVRWCGVWSEIKGELYLGELKWLSNHLGFKLFKLGRLQFCMGKTENDIDKLGIKRGDNVIEIHIPSGEPLDTNECKESIEEARKFFEKYFPKFKYEYFSCHSWLLDETLKRFLPDDSNIIKFGNMFEKCTSDKSEDIFKYVFGWNVRRYCLKNCQCSSSFAKRVKEYALSGGEFFTTLGFIKK